MKAKVFKSGNSLAIRLPKALNLTKDCEFNIKQITTLFQHQLTQIGIVYFQQ